MRNNRYLDSMSRKTPIVALTRGVKGGLGKSTISGVVLEMIMHGSSAVALTRVRRANKQENKT